PSMVSPPPPPCTCASMKPGTMIWPSLASSSRSRGSAELMVAPKRSRARSGPPGSIARPVSSCMESDGQRDLGQMAGLVGIESAQSCQVLDQQLTGGQLDEAGSDGMAARRQLHGGAGK